MRPPFCNKLVRKIRRIFAYSAEPNVLTAKKANCVLSEQAEAD
jgi:hypothetical protein